MDNNNPPFYLPDEEERDEAPFYLPPETPSAIPAEEEPPFYIDSEGPGVPSAPLDEEAPFYIREETERQFDIPEPGVDARAVNTGLGLMDIDAIVNEYQENYGRRLIKEDFLEDERLQELVYQNLEARNIGTSGSLVSSALGAQTPTGITNLREQDFEDVFELWQNYHRSFAGGQTVTLANDIAYTLNQDDETKAKIGAGYVLFDSMENAFTGEGTWAETGDAIFDYVRSAIWDPATILSLGVGKVLSAGGQRAASMAARSAMVGVYRDALSRNVAGRVAMTAIGNAARAAPYIAPDMVINAGSDVAQQMQMITTGAQEEYSAVQTGLAAAGSMAIPALLTVSSGVGALRRSAITDNRYLNFLKPADLDYVAENLTGDQAWDLMSTRLDSGSLIDAIDENFGKLQGSIEDILPWEQVREEAVETVAAAGEQINDARAMTLFEKFFWFGNPNESGGGYFNALKDNGFVIHPSMLENNSIPAVYGEAIKFIQDDAVVARLLNRFEDAAGVKLDIEPTVDGLRSHFASRSRTAGEILNIRSELSRLERMGLSGRELLETATNTAARDDSPQIGRYAVGVYKRLLTSHLSTTGANIKGFTALVGLDSLADFFSAATYATQGSLYRIFGGNADTAADYMMRARGSLMAPARRLVGAFSPDMDMAYAQRIFEMAPDVRERLFRELAGDSGPNRALQAANIDPNNRVFGAVDSITRGAQHITGVQLQDDWTKTWAFASNLDREIMRRYGQDINEFWNRQDAALEFRSEKFQEGLNRAVYLTQRQTGSVNWSTLPNSRAGQNAARSIARFLEEGANRQLGGSLGYVFPFTSFMNTTIATMSDLTGVNLIRRVSSNAWNAARGRGPGVLDYADQDFGELLGKTAIGWVTILGGVPAAVERIQNGLAYNQDVNDLGSVEDKTFDWPMSTVRLMSQMIAHGLYGDRLSTEPNELFQQVMSEGVEFRLNQVPDDLKSELFKQVGGQAIRDFDEGIQFIEQTITSALSGDEDITESLGQLVSYMVARPFQGYTRPLDPINTVVGLARDGNMNPDLRQGPEVLNQSMRYINQLLPSVSGVDDLPRRATATRGTEPRTDLGRQLLGARTTSTPNLAEQMFNSAGIPSWRAVQWNGPPEVKNYMDGLAAPIFEQEARRALEANPDFGNLSTIEKQAILGDMRTRVRQRVMTLMETRGRPRTLDVARQLAGANQTQLRRVMRFLQMEGDLSDVIRGENPMEDLNRIKYFMDNYDDIFYGDINLGQ
jgi:hypothetical protein